MHDLDAVYDEPTVARLDRAGVRANRPNGAEPSAASARRTGWRRGAIAGGLVTGLALGLREVFDPPPDEEIVLEVDIDAPPLDNRPARFEMVVGIPAASSIILRPWLTMT